MFSLNNGTIDPNLLWRILSKLKIYPRIKIFTWQLIQDCLPNLITLCKKKLLNLTFVLCAKWSLRLIIIFFLTAQPLMTLGRNFLILRLMRILIFYPSFSTIRVKLKFSLKSSPYSGSSRTCVINLSLIEPP